MTSLPEAIDRILEYLADMAASYTGGLKWNEEAKLKADLMNAPERWRGVSTQAVSERCLELGMSTQDTATIVGFISKAQAGRRLIPHRSYKEFKFR